MTINSNRVVILLILFYLVSYPVEVKSGGCPNANFPLALGGPQDETSIKAFDYLPAFNKYVIGGWTKCNDLKAANEVYIGVLPLIATYKTDKNGLVTIDWGFTLALVGHVASAVTFSRDGLNVVSLLEKKQ
jgi:hypothetical protein